MTWAPGHSVTPFDPWLFIDPLDGPIDPWGSMSTTLRTTVLDWSVIRSCGLNQCYAFHCFLSMSTRAAFPLSVDQSRTKFWSKDFPAWLSAENFPRGQRRYFAHTLQVSDDAMQIYFHKTLYSFYTTKKMPYVTVTNVKMRLLAAVARNITGILRWNTTRALKIEQMNYEDMPQQIQLCTH